MGKDPLIKFNLNAARVAFEMITKLDLHSVSLDEIKEHLTPIICGYKVDAPRISAGLNLYSGLLGSKPVDINEIGYRPADIISNSSSTVNKIKSNDFIKLHL